MAGRAFLFAPSVSDVCCFCQRFLKGSGSPPAALDLAFAGLAADSLASVMTTAEFTSVYPLSVENRRIGYVTGSINKASGVIIPTDLCAVLGGGVQLDYSGGEIVDGLSIVDMQQIDGTPYYTGDALKTWTNAAATPYHILQMPPLDRDGSTTAFISTTGLAATCKRHWWLPLDDLVVDLYLLNRLHYSEISSGTTHQETRLVHWQFNSKAWIECAVGVMGIAGDPTCDYKVGVLVSAWTKVLEPLSVTGHEADPGFTLVPHINFLVPDPTNAYPGLGYYPPVDAAHSDPIFNPMQVPQPVVGSRVDLDWTDVDLNGGSITLGVDSPVVSPGRRWSCVTGSGSAATVTITPAA